MSRSGALARAYDLRDELQARGVQVSIELQQGRPGTPNDRWYDTRFIGSMGHHTVSSRSNGLTPVLWLVKAGRSDVPGPLCNGYLGFDGVARIICMGWANHPGAGGPLSLPGGTIPRDGARPYLFGWEIEGGIRESDWDQGGFREIMGKCHAATLAWLARDERSHSEHSTWTPRKIDRLGYTLSEARAELKPHLTPQPPKEWDEMATKAEIQDAVRDVVRAEIAKDGWFDDNFRKAFQKIMAEAAERSTPAGRHLGSHLKEALDLAGLDEKIALAVHNFKNKTTNYNTGFMVRWMYQNLGGKNRPEPGAAGASVPEDDD